MLYNHELMSLINKVLLFFSRTESIFWSLAFVTQKQAGFILLYPARPSGLCCGHIKYFWWDLSLEPPKAELWKCKSLCSPVLTGLASCCLLYISLFVCVLHQDILNCNWNKTTMRKPKNRRRRWLPFRSMGSVLFYFLFLFYLFFVKGVLCSPMHHLLKIQK